MIDRNVFREVDWPLMGLLFLTAAVGCLLIYSATFNQPGHVYMKQVIWMAVAVLGFSLALIVDYKVLVAYAPVFYVAGLVILGGLFVFARFIGGAKSWFRLAFIGIQPSEIMKLVLILILARFFAEYKRRYVSLGRALLIIGVAIAPAVMVALQPDLGTAATFVPLILAAMLLAGLSRKAVVLLLVAALVGGFLGYQYGLKDYQKKRVMTLFSPGLDPKGSGYQIAQSKIAIGSGGVLGKGFKKGTQSQLRFLPARHTDFIFSVLGEEFGFVGITAVMALYLMLLLRIFRIVGKARDRSGIYIVFLVGILLTFQFLVNVLMVIGLFPVTGIPLPLLSYGGSSLLAGFIAVGLVVNVKMRRFVNI
jgi:rod shape determining protein RodA